MTQRLGTKAALGWASTTDGVAEQLHQLAVPLRELQPASSRRVYAVDSLDYTVREVLTVGNGVPEFVGSVRYDDSPQGVADLLKAGASGATITYYPDMRDPGTSYPCLMIEPSANQLAADLDPQRKTFGNVSTTIRLRPTSFAPPTPIYRGTAVLAWYRGGEGLLGATVSRAGQGTWTNKGLGTISYGASNLIRTIYRDLDGDGIRESPLLLIEEQRTNAFSFSEDLSNAVWTKARVSVVTNATTAPDGTSNGDQVKEDSSNNSHLIERAPGTLTTNATQSQSWFAKANGRTQIQVWTLTKANNVYTSTYDLSAGTTVAGAGHTTTIEPFANGWYRCTVAWSAESGATTPLWRIFLMSGGVTTYTGDGASGVFLWGMQNEVDKPFASTYVPALSASTTRGTDIVTLPFSAKPQAMTIYCRMQDRGTASLSRPVLCVGSNGSANILIEGVGTGYRANYTSTSSSIVTGGTAQLPASTDVVELLLTLDGAGNISLTQVSGGNTTTVSQGPLPLPTAWGTTGLRIGSYDGVTTGFAAYLNLVVMRGVQDLPTMRRIATV